MAITRSFGGRTLLKPGAYSVSRVDNAQGIVVGNNDTLYLIGEASDGLSGDAEGGARIFTASQVQQLVDYYGSGDIVDAALAAARPSITPGIGGVGNIVVYKTNGGVRAEAAINLPSMETDIDDGAIVSIAGINLIEGTDWEKSGETADPAAGPIAAIGTFIFDEALDTGAEIFTLVVPGLVDQTVDSPPNRASLINALNLLDGITAVDDSGTAANQILITAETPGVAGNGIVLSVDDPTGITGLPLTLTLGAEATPEVNPIFLTAQSLANAINGEATLGDIVVASVVEIPAVGVSFPSTANVISLRAARPGPDGNTIPFTTDDTDIILVAFAGGMDDSGTSSALAYNDALTEAFNHDVNVIVPLFSTGTTELPIETVLANLRNHLIDRSSVERRLEAQGIAAVRRANWRDVIEIVDDVRSELLQVVFQDVRVIDSVGALAWKEPHIMAAILAGIRLGSEVGEPLTFKFLNVNGVGHFINPDTGLTEAGPLFRPGFDFNEAILAGLTFTEVASGGNRIVVDNTTYGLDASFVFNRGSVVEAAQFVARSSRQVLETIFVGQKVSAGAALSLRNVLRNHLLSLFEQTIITASDDAPFGFVEETFVVTITGNTASIQVEVKPVQGLDFVFISFTLGNITQTA